MIWQDRLCTLLSMRVVSTQSIRTESHFRFRFDWNSICRCVKRTFMIQGTPGEAASKQLSYRPKSFDEYELLPICDQP